MRKFLYKLPALLSGLLLLLSACQAAPRSAPNQPLKVLAVETFLADITQNVAGDRLKVDSLIPIGMDPHAFEPTPQDVVRISQSQVLITNGAGVEAWLTKTLDNAGGNRTVIEASSGLTPRKPGPGELPDPDGAVDPHFWLDPVNVIKYVENIRDGLSQADPAGTNIYAQNAAKYIAQLKELDTWIKSQVSQIPPERRLLVTNHEALGYFADRYGFSIIGAVIPSTSTEASPSARQMADLIDNIKQKGVKAIFLEVGANPDLANQVAQETGAVVINNMDTHSITGPEGDAPTYIDMMRHNVNLLMILK